MANLIKFTKMHGAGNDYIYVNTLEYPIDHPEKFAIKWSAPHTGIGSDGLVLIGKSPIADFSMRIFNADGSEAMMCGNASRCIGKYLYDNKLTDKTDITLDTLSGIKYLKLIISATDGKVSTVSVNMGSPKLEEVMIDGKPENIISKEFTVNNQIYKATAISMGNPHLVIYIDDIEKIDLPTVGPILENHPLFPGRINVEFAQKLENNKVRMRVWERGSGITMACGTGACATAVAGSIIGETGRDVEIIMDGGSLNIKWDEQTDSVFMTGEAVTVFEGEIAL